MANIDYEALKEQLVAQGIALPELNFCVVKAIRIRKIPLVNILALELLRK